MLCVDVVVALCALTMKEGAKVESNDLPFILLSRSLNTHHKGIERASAGVNQEASTQLKHIGSVQRSLKKTVTTIVGYPGSKNNDHLN